MSITLTLGFDRYLTVNRYYLGISGAFNAFTTMGLHYQSDALFARLRELAVPFKQTRVFERGDEDMREITTDPYGEPLTWIQAHHLTRELAGLHLRDEWDAAVRAYVAAIPQDAPVLLYWR